MKLSPNKRRRAFDESNLSPYSEDASEGENLGFGGSAIALSSPIRSQAPIACRSNNGWIKSTSPRRGWCGYRPLPTYTTIGSFFNPLHVITLSSPTPVG